MLIHLIAAARPNFMKIAPLYHALKKQDWADSVIVHTGQHYDLNMSDAIFEDLGLPEPDLHLSIPCLTMRPNTERPITINKGTNQLSSPEKLENHVEAILSGRVAQASISRFWDGKTAKRIVQSVKKILP